MPPLARCPTCGKTIFQNWSEARLAAHRLNQQKKNNGDHLEPYQSRRCGGAIHIGGHKKRRMPKLHRRMPLRRALTARSGGRHDEKGIEMTNDIGERIESIGEDIQ